MGPAAPIAIAGIFLLNLRAIRMWDWWHQRKPRLIETVGSDVSGTVDEPGVCRNGLERHRTWKDFSAAELSENCAALHLYQAAIPVARSWALYWRVARLGHSTPPAGQRRGRDRPSGPATSRAPH